MNSISPSNGLRVQIDQNTLARLISEGHLCAADLHCLDNQSHDGVREICKRCCLQNLSRRR